MNTLPPQPWMADPALQSVMTALGEARFVGGCVRDALLGRPVADIDIATPLKPEETMAALRAAGLKFAPTGVEHGTVTAIAGGKGFEVTTLRRDVETDGRRAVVAFTRDWSEDAERRDFRLNALYLDLEGNLYDPAGGGIEDALAGRIVFVGEARTRIREDYLRILRFFRFWAWYGRGDPDAEAVAAIAELKAGVAGLSGERVAKELLKLLAAPEPRPSVRLAAETGVLAVALPEATNLSRFEAMVGIDPDPVLRLAALLTGLDAGLAAGERLRLSNAQRERLRAALTEGEPLSPDIDGRSARRRLYGWGLVPYADRVKLAWAGAGGDWAPALAHAEGWTRPVLPVGGGDAKAAGIEPGPLMGQALRAVEAWWIGEDFLPDRAAVLAKLKEFAREDRHTGDGPAA
jgi:poly(A) polymerase